MKGFNILPTLQFLSLITLNRKYMLTKSILFKKKLDELVKWDEFDERQCQLSLRLAHASVLTNNMSVGFYKDIT